MSIPFNPIPIVTSENHLQVLDWRIQGVTGSFEWPRIATRVSASDSLASVATAYFGVDSGITTSDASFDAGYVDYLRAKPQAIYSNTTLLTSAQASGNDYLDFLGRLLDDVVGHALGYLITTAFHQSTSVLHSVLGHHSLVTPA